MAKRSDWDDQKFPRVGKPGDQLYRQGRCSKCGIALFGKVVEGQPPKRRRLCGDCRKGKP